MLNTPHNRVFDTPRTLSDDGLLRTSSGWRIYGVGILFCILAAVVLVRVAWVQTQLSAGYLAALTSTVTEYELLAARDGRVLTDTTVLATDVDRYDLQLHYRWLESPVNQQWLDRQIPGRLTRQERRDQALVNSARTQILADREAVQQAIANATGLSIEELRQRCAAVQQQVERVANAVNQRHAAVPAKELPDSEDDGILMKMASAVRAALTTPPRRQSNDRIIVREEETFHTIVTDVTLPVAALIAEQPQDFPGVRTLVRTVRTYPEESLAAHVVGARTELQEDESSNLPQPEGLVAGAHVERRGRFGVEYSYDQQISGRPGLRKIVRDRRQRIVSDEIVRAPVSGRDIVLTVDTNLQQTCESLLKQALGDAPLRELLPRSDQEAPEGSRHLPVGGSIVVMEAATGRLLAAASGPDFKLSLFTGGSAEQWKAANDDPRRPFIARFTGMALPPGSTFKTLTAIAALESGVITPQSTLHCQGYLTRPTEHRCLIFRMYGASHQRIGLRMALAQSCNVFFFDAAQRMGIITLSQWANRLQFGHPTGIDLPFEKAGTVPLPSSRIATVSASQQSRFERETLGLAIGQSRLTVTPLQMARLMAVVANGGWLVTPQVVSDEGYARAATEAPRPQSVAPRYRIDGLQPQTLTAIRDGLKATVQNAAGTGYRDIRDPGISLAGKTGTAETAPDKPDHAWFAGYLPADDPQVVIVVVMEHGGSGSRVAGPVAREVSRAVMESQLLRDTGS